MTTQEQLGRLGLPSSLADLTSRRWDAVVVGAGHNGLTAAAYLARAGRSVLVLEGRDRIGGACTLDQPFPDPRWLVSPSAYSVGLLHPLVVDELGLHRRGPTGYTWWTPTCGAPSRTAPPSRCGTIRIAARLPLPPWHRAMSRATGPTARSSPASAGGCERASATRGWGPRPQRPELEEPLAGDPEAHEVVFEASIADVVERFVHDERLRTALHGQGIIGTYAGPRETGDRSRPPHARIGEPRGPPRRMGVRPRRHGRVSFALADAAIEVGAAVATGVPVAAIIPGEGVRLEGGETVRAGVVVSNVDPKRTVGLCREGVPDSFRARVSDGRRRARC